jgi:hypothetical protein
MAAGGVNAVPVLDCQNVLSTERCGQELMPVGTGKRSTKISYSTDRFSRKRGRRGGGLTRLMCARFGDTWPRHTGIGRVGQAMDSGSKRDGIVD